MEKIELSVFDIVEFSSEIYFMVTTIMDNQIVLTSFRGAKKRKMTIDELMNVNTVIMKPSEFTKMIANKRKLIFNEMIRLSKSHLS